jgi:hypothetical protein
MDTGYTRMLVRDHTQEAGSWIDCHDGYREQQLFSNSNALAEYIATITSDGWELISHIINYDKTSEELHPILETLVFRRNPSTKAPISPVSLPPPRPSLPS